MLNRSYRKKLRYRISNKKSKPINTYMNRVKTDKRIQIDHTQNKFNFTKQSRFEKFWGLPDGSLKPIFFICIFILSMHLLRKIANDDSLLSVINDALFLNEEANKVIIINTCIGVLTSFLVIKSIEKNYAQKILCRSFHIFYYFISSFPRRICSD